ncbi:hypothetical protein SAMD00019534_120180 [Acytostelium subglobosum LB1]|uniref:hypothetical protein n=1 Tax=Acytostelium subglobosum LB1 TaxID=1410327 RepID=UPI0006450AB0|nr:hypothetical protein SAMD00019534_120180 [Acytostelium subglobosum LB1]GAM28842.1 hypothetical protein SAMD00019534_120180 [Acytostelium subglobosum LB1]|eukprot:XP_012748214.1 hypothetical protein SAMD00019534_120180 [Acytostelium subglobosum LB1]
MNFNQSNVQSPESTALLGNINDGSIDDDDHEFDYEGNQRISTWTTIKNFLARVFLPKGEMPHDDRINMDWLQKWRKYNRFPFKLVVHLVITICLTVLIFVQTGDLTSYSVGTEGTWYKVFFPSDFQYEGDFGANVIYLYTVQDCVDLIQEDLNNYNTFLNTSVSKFKMLNAGTSEPPYQAQLSIAMYKHCDQIYDTSIMTANMDTETTRYTVTSDNIGPLNASLDTLQEMFFCMSSMWLEFEFSNVHIEYDHPVEYTWTIAVNFDNSIQSGRVSTSLILTKYRVSDLPYSKLIQSSKMILEIILIIFSLLSQIMAWRSFMFSFKTFQRTKKLVRRISSKQKLSASINWGSLPIRTKLRFFNLWFIVCFICNFCTIIGASLDFFEATSNATKLLIGFATLLSWINMIRYLEFDRKSIALVRALGMGLPTVLRFSAGSLPIFIGFALFGLMYFSETSSRFSTFGEAIVTLFGLQNGDDIQSTFRSTEKSPIVSRIYFFVFIFISMYAVANIYIAIMEGAYSQCVGIKSKLERKKDEEDSQRQAGDELNVDDQLWDQLLGLKESSDSESEIKKKKKRRLIGKLATNRSMTESQIISADRAVGAFDMDLIIEEVSKAILEKQLEFNKEVQKLIKNSIHQRIETMVKAHQISVSNVQDDDNSTNSSNNNNNNNNTSSNNNADQSASSKVDQINIFTDDDNDDVDSQ